MVASSPPPTGTSRIRRAIAFAVHAYTASGVLCGAFAAGKDRPVVLGFSAAAPQALDLAVAERKRIAGLVIVAGRVEIGAATAKKLGKGFPVKLVYGRSDPVVPRSVGEAALRVLRDAGVAATLDIVPTILEASGIPNPSMQKWLSWEFADMCRDCKVLPLCVGSCPLKDVRSEDYGGDIGEARCRNYRYNIRDNLRAFAERRNYGLDRQEACAGCAGADCGGER